MSALNTTTLVSILVVVIFAVVTQLLTATGAISLSTALQLTMWLAALGFVVLLVIAYMFFRVFEPVDETATSSHQDYLGPIPEPAPVPDAGGQGDTTPETQASAGQMLNGDREGTQLGQDAGSPRNPTAGSRPFIPSWAPDGIAQTAGDTWVPPDGLRHLEGTEYSVSTEQVFPDGVYLVPDSITLVSDKLTGLQVYECRVVDLNPALNDRPHETVVKILGSQEPSQASIPRFSRVEFEHLTITPYVTDQNPMWIRYLLRASGFHPAAPPTERQQALWSVPPQGGAPPEEIVARASTEDASSGAAGTS